MNVLDLVDTIGMPTINIYQWRRSYYREGPSFDKRPKLPEGYFELYGMGIKFDCVKSMKKLQNIWEKHYGGDTDFYAPTKVGHVMIPRFLLCWRGGKEFTSLFCVLKSYNKKEKKCWHYNKIKNRTLWIADLHDTDLIKWTEFENGKWL